MTTLGLIVLALGGSFLVYMIKNDIEFARMSRRVNRLEERLAAVTVNNAADHEKFLQIHMEMAKRLDPVVESYEYERTLRALTGAQHSN